jgi:hypothetical protein
VVDVAGFLPSSHFRQPVSTAQINSFNEQSVPEPHLRDSHGGKLEVLVLEFARMECHPPISGLISTKEATGFVWTAVGLANYSPSKAEDDSPCPVAEFPHQLELETDSYGISSQV